MLLLIVLICDQLLLSSSSSKSNLSALFDLYQTDYLLHDIQVTTLVSFAFLYWNFATDSVWCWIMPTSQLYGTLTRKLHDIWRQAAVFGGEETTTGTTAANGSSFAAAATPTTDQQRAIVTEIQQLFHSIDIYPTESQVYEMIQCASRCSLSRNNNNTSAANAENNKNAPNGTALNGGNNKLTFGEFCFFASVLINSYRQNIAPPKPLTHSDLFIRKLERLETISDNSAQNDTNFEVFLGGSCNPTRWRTDIVIPELKRLNVTYYNPQVEHWGPELIELESYAKQNSEILFFVVDNQTRAIASMIEVAFIASTHRKLILVINDLPGPKCKIVNDELSLEEYENLRKGRAFLRDVVERQGIPIFTQIPEALKSAVRVLRDDIWPQDLTQQDSDNIIPVKMGHVSVGDKMIHMFKVFESLKNPKNQFTFAELALAYRALKSRDLSRELIRQMAKAHLDSNNSSDSTTSSPSLSRSSSSDEPEEEQFEMVNSAINGNSNNNKKPKSRGKKSRKLKKAQDLFATSTDSAAAVADSLPPLDEIVIDFDQFCCIMSELSEKAQQLAAQEALRAQNGFADCEQQRSSSSGGILQIPGKVLEKVGSLFNVFSIMKTMLSIPADGEQQQQQSSSPSSKPQVQNSHSHFHHAHHLSHSFPSRSATPPLLTKGSSHSSSVRRSMAAIIDENNPISSYDAVPHHFRPAVGPRSASPSLFRHRHSYSSPSVGGAHHHPQHNHLGPHYLPGHLSYGQQSVQHHSQSSLHQPHPQSPLLPSALRRGGPPFHSSTSSITSLLYDNYTDLYIGGCLEEALLNQSIIPLLKKYSITYSTLKADRWTSQRMIPLEAKNIEKSRVLLFLITKDSLDISYMIMAAHYVGLGYNVVLCIQNIDSSSPFVISDGKNETWLSTDAIKDYNRGRSYLSDLATKMGVPVFSDVNESIQCCIEKILSSD